MIIINVSIQVFIMLFPRRSLFRKISQRFHSLEIQCCCRDRNSSALAVINGESFSLMSAQRSCSRVCKYADHMRMTALRNNENYLYGYIRQSPAALFRNQGKYILYVGNKSTNSSSWDLMPGDLYDNSADDDSSQATIDISKSGNHHKIKVSIGDWGSSIGGPYTGNKDCIVFSPRGWVLNPASDFNGQGFIEITFVNKVARSTGVNHDYIVMIARSGMTRIDNEKARLNDKYFSGTSYDASE